MSWVLAFHIISMVCWFSGLFYLPRLFVYHAMSTDQVSKDRFVIMERKLLNGITTPSAIATLIFGVWLVSFNPAYYMDSSWFHWKLMLVIILIFYHLLCYRFTWTFKVDRNTRSHRFFRYFNEFPVLLLVSIIILVTVKPG